MELEDGPVEDIGHDGPPQGALAAAAYNADFLHLVLNQAEVVLDGVGHPLQYGPVEMSAAVMGRGANKAAPQPGVPVGGSFPHQIGVEEQSLRPGGHLLRLSVQGAVGAAPSPLLALPLLLAEGIPVPAQAFCGGGRRQTGIPQAVHHMGIGQRLGVGLRLLPEEVECTRGGQLGHAAVFCNGAHAVRLHSGVAGAVDDGCPRRDSGEAGCLGGNASGDVAGLNQRRQNRQGHAADTAQLIRPAPVDVVKEQTALGLNVVCRPGSGQLVAHVVLDEHGAGGLFQHLRLVVVDPH